VKQALSNQLKDTEFLSITARVKVFETRLLTREQMEQLLDARTNEDAARILQEHGYPELNPANPEKMDAAMAVVRQATLDEMTVGLPEPRYLDLFKIKYDYHNVKALLKAQAMGVDADRMLMDMGRVPATELRGAVLDGEKAVLPPLLSQAIGEARGILDTTRDPQLSDIALDRRYYEDLCSAADALGSDFLRNYVRLQIDATNLRILVRTLRMGRDTDFLRGAFIPGGSLSPEKLLEAAEKGTLEALCRSLPLEAAAKAGVQALGGGSLTEFEKLCDDAADAYLAVSKYVPFGEEPLIRYLAARETEYLNLRIILTGRQAGIAPDVIRSRLRASTL